MFTLILSIALAQAEVKPLPESPTAQQFVEAAWTRRLKGIEDLQKKLDDLPKATDFSKLTPQAIEKIVKPHKDRIAKANANPEIDWNLDYPFNAEPGEIFRFPRSNPRLNINDEHTIHYAIDETSVAVSMDKNTYGDRLAIIRDSKIKAIGARTRDTIKQLQAVDEWYREECRHDMITIIQGLKPGEFLDRKGAPIKLTGLWRRIDPIKIDGKDRIVIERWPHEDEVKKLWPKYLKEKMKLGRKP